MSTKKNKRQSPRTNFDVTEKTCCKCKKTMRITRFPRDKTKRDGRMYICGICVSAKQKLYRAKIKEQA